MPPCRAFEAPSADRRTPGGLDIPSAKDRRGNPATLRENDGSERKQGKRPIQRGSGRQEERSKLAPRMLRVLASSVFMAR